MCVGKSICILFQPAYRAHCGSAVATVWLHLVLTGQGMQLTCCSVYLCMHVCVCIHVSVHICVCMDVYVCTYICMYVHMFLMYTEHLRVKLKHDACNSWGVIVFTGQLDHELVQKGHRKINVELHLIFWCREHRCKVTIWCRQVMNSYHIYTIMLDPSSIRDLG